MSEKLQSNPFAALFCSVKDAEQFSKQHLASETQSPPDDQINGVGDKSDKITAFLESLLLVTTRGEGPHNSPHVLLESSDSLSLETLPLLLFDRLLVEAPETQLVGPKGMKKDEASQKEVVVYLSEAYRRCLAARDKPLAWVAKQVQEALVTNLTTALEQPELYPNQQPENQLLQVLLHGLGQDAAVEDLAYRLTCHLADQGVTKPPLPFEWVLVEVSKQLGACSLMAVDYHLVSILNFYASSPYLATLLTQTPGNLQQVRMGRDYQNTPLGSLLSISCLPSHPGLPCQFFEKPSSQPAQAHKDTENSIWLAQNNLNARIYKIFYALLKVSEEAKDGLLSWIESCLEANSGRAGLWHVQGGGGGLEEATFVSDGFMVNLGDVMLQLAQPFTQDLKTAKILKVDPTYCAAPRVNQEGGVPGAYTGDLGAQTPLVPHPENAALPHSQQYSFISACFFLTHRALHLGVQVMQQKLHKLSIDLGRLQREVQEASAQGSPAMEMMRTLMESRTATLLSFKAAIFEPQMAESLWQFLGASAEWLVQISFSPTDQLTPPTTLQKVVLPLPEEQESHPFLCCIPEFLVETLTETITAVRRYAAALLDSAGGSRILSHFMSFIVMFMGSPRRMNNPHLRAHLAECLETLLPDNGAMGSLLAGFREQLFDNHPLSAQLVPALIQVFVSIEMTGQNVSFEEKFNYRRPMYEVMKYLWESPKHRKRFIDLANEALSNMEAAQPPLFLRFVNLLMNDSIYLLAEGLDYISQLRESEKERDAGEWQSLPPPQRSERERNFQQMSRLANFHNMLGSHTIKTLVRLTKEIPQMFTHSTLVDRIAAMLNYFLSTLVGPKQRNLKVRDMEKYDFRPGETVSDICTIYIHLYSDQSFCLAVSSDGRSYTPQLFSQAYDVLCRIGRGSLAEELQLVDRKVVAESQAHAEDEDIATEAPEEFLDPIMSHLMMDPVTLPSSKITCDRQTIARHLLSDQTDPFNRQPLTMDEVMPNTELKAKITSWLKEQRTLRAGKPKDFQTDPQE